MGKFISGKFQYIWNSGTGDLRIYDVFADGSVRENIPKTGVSGFIDAKQAVNKLDDVIDYYARCAEAYKNSSLYGKVYSTKCEIHKQIRTYIVDRNRLK